MKQYSPGDQIGGVYTSLNVFGGENQSGMGVVYLVQSIETPGPVVLKTYQHPLGRTLRISLYLKRMHGFLLLLATTGFIGRRYNLSLLRVGHQSSSNKFSHCTR